MLVRKKLNVKWSVIILPVPGEGVFFGITGLSSSLGFLATSLAFDSGFVTSTSKILKVLRPTQEISKSCLIATLLLNYLNQHECCIKNTCLGFFQTTRLNRFGLFSDWMLNRFLCNLYSILWFSHFKYKPHIDNRNKQKLKALPSIEDLQLLNYCMVPSTWWFLFPLSSLLFHWEKKLGLFNSLAYILCFKIVMVKI